MASEAPNQPDPMSRIRNSKHAADSNYCGNMSRVQLTVAFVTILVIGTVLGLYYGGQSGITTPFNKMVQVGPVEMKVLHLVMGSSLTFAALQIAWVLGRCCHTDHREAYNQMRDDAIAVLARLERPKEEKSDDSGDEQPVAV